MRYRTNVTVMTGGKAFKPGSILPDDISASDLAFLKAKKFISPVDVAAVVTEPEETGDGEGGGFPTIPETGAFTLKSPDEIRKIRAKKDVAAYAKKIGLELGNFSEKSLNELQEDVINFQEEMESGGAGSEEE